MDRLAARLVRGCLNQLRRNPISAFTPEDVRNVNLSFSQFGEDLVIAGYLCKIPKARRGIYIDVGCYDPIVFSNTRLLHLLGYRGICIDANPICIDRFNRVRPEDFNRCAALSSQREYLYYLEFDVSACNRLSVTNLPMPSENLITAKRVQTARLCDVISSSPYRDHRVDLLTIDIEGFDLAVLRTYDLTRNRPRLICIESNNSNSDSDIDSFLSTSNYRKLAERRPSLIYIDNQSDITAVQRTSLLDNAMY